MIHLSISVASFKAFDSSFESEDNEGLKNTLVKEVELIHLEVRTNGDRLGAFFVGEQAKSEIR